MPRAWRAAPPTTTRSRQSAGAQRQPRLWPFRELGEVRLSLLHVRVAAFLRLFAHVVEKGRVTGQLLDARQAVVNRIEASLQHPKRERAQLEHAPAPRHRLLLEV